MNLKNMDQIKVEKSAEKLHALDVLAEGQSAERTQSQEVTHAMEATSEGVSEVLGEVAETAPQKPAEDQAQRVKSRQVAHLQKIEAHINSLSENKLRHDIADKYNHELHALEKKAKSLSGFFVRKTDEHALAGRTLEKILLDKEKFVLANKLFADPSGAKMGKTTGNMVALNQSPREMFGAVMSWTDGMIEVGFQLCTACSQEKLDEVKKRLASGENPKNLKMELGLEIVSFFYDEESAGAAKAEFENMFAKGGTPDEMPELKIADAKFNILHPEIVKASGVSSSELRRLVQGGGVKINDERVEDLQAEYENTGDLILKIGKRKFFQIVK